MAADNGNEVQQSNESMESMDENGFPPIILDSIANKSTKRIQFTPLPGAWKDPGLRATVHNILIRLYSILV